MGLTKNSTGIRVLSSDDITNNKKADYKIALAGNPNVGKSTVFNALTGLRQHTGNWPGKTVANAEGYYEYKGNTIKVIDLPGTYSLLSNSEEEEIARNYICFSKPDLVVVVVDATSLERNLNLFLQISELTEKVVLCVNLIDEARKKGISINEEKLKSYVGDNVVLTAARQNVGIEDLKERVQSLINEKEKDLNYIKYNDEIEKGINLIKDILKKNLELNELKSRWVALRFIEGNENINKDIVKNYSINDEVLEKIQEVRNKISISSKDLSDSIIKTLFKRAECISKNSVETKKIQDVVINKIDKILVSKVTGIPVMILLLLLILWITITLANYPSELLSMFFENIKQWLMELLEGSILPSWLSSILIDGMYTTLAWVVSVMLPPMAIFFPLFTLLEDLGYLPRVAFNLDKCFKKCCSCGKQALTMCMGLGCNAAGVIGCRIIDSPRERLIAIITNVFMPCNGRFPTLITISTIFIGGGIVGGIQGNLFSALAVTVVIIAGVFMTFIISKILSKTILKGIPSNFILELPPFRKPQVGKVIIRSICDRTLYVLGRAAAIAAPAGIVIWIFANVPLGDGTILSVCAGFLEPLGNAIGLDGYILMAFILGFPANEIVIPVLIMSYLRTGSMMEMDSLLELKNLFIANGWTTLTAINMMIMCLMHYPCGTTLWTIKKESGSIKWTILSFLIPTVMGIIVCFITTQIWKVI